MGSEYWADWGPIWGLVVALVFEPSLALVPNSMMAGSSLCATCTLNSVILTVFN